MRIAAAAELRFLSPFDKLETQRAHIRSAEVEGILAEAGDLTTSGYYIYNALNDSDLKLGTIEDDNGQKLKYVEPKKK